MSQPWTDPETQKEYPPLVLDTERSMINNAVPLLHPVIANNIGVSLLPYFSLIIIAVMVYMHERLVKKTAK